MLAGLATNCTLENSFQHNLQLPRITCTQEMHQSIITLQTTSSTCSCSYLQSFPPNNMAVVGWGYQVVVGARQWGGEWSGGRPRVVAIYPLVVLV